MVVGAGGVGKTTVSATLALCGAVLRGKKTLVLTIDPARRKLNNLAKAFDFTQTPNTPALPSAAQLFPDAQQTILTLNAARTVADCSTDVPSWLLPLLGVT